MLHFTAATSLRERNVAARRQRILDSAREILAREGVAGLSMRKLAEEAGLAVKTLYNLWGSRAAILQGVISQAMDRMDEALEGEAPLREDPLERCRAVVTVTIRHLVADEAVFRTLLLASFEVQEGRALREGPVTARASHMQAVALREAVEQGLLEDVHDPELLGRQIYHGYEMAHVQWAFGVIDEAGFRARALYGLYVALLGAATKATRPRILAALHEQEEILRAQRSERAPQRPPHPRARAHGRDRSRR